MNTQNLQALYYHKLKAYVFSWNVLSQNNTKRKNNRLHNSYAVEARNMNCYRMGLHSRCRYVLFTTLFITHRSSVWQLIFWLHVTPTRAEFTLALALALTLPWLPRSSLCRGHKICWHCNVGKYVCLCETGWLGGGTIYGQRYYAYFKIFRLCLKALKARVSANLILLY